ncbi:PDDEXK family nuclease [Caldicellulosiruptor naganoensis]|uniref:Uma2 family endonuclease n=1 Tax=Caldicellulosiruptor naganoensis TaxID=29324 RepID=A0ABY7BIV5_9FIRM|nr:Uma2 family endonuclease [Caldicellulosiruptor naganoensis]WAM32749.1 Uma2 family endonuclease [Caldicellulosiruptor naganoensis]
MKLSVYEKFQVSEYWIVDISNECIEVYSNNINGKYCSINKYKKGMSIKVFDNLVLDVDEIFSVIK